MTKHIRDRQRVIESIQSLFEEGNLLIWDTETTGKYPETARIVSIGIINAAGQTQLDTLINPGIAIPSDSTRIHGLTDEHVANAPTFPEIYQTLNWLLKSKVWIIYNSKYDTTVLEHECDRHNLPRIQPDRVHCAMKAYAQFEGTWNHNHNHYKWWKLAEATDHMRITEHMAHHAIGDSLMTLELMRKMAGE